MTMQIGQWTRGQTSSQARLGAQERRLRRQARTAGQTGEQMSQARQEPHCREQARIKWISVEGGSSNSGGHAYGNANVKAPALLLDQTKTMPVDGSLKPKLRPMTEDMNFGVFYTYGSDSDGLCRL